MDSGTSESPFFVQFVCDGSRFVEQGDGKGLKSKLKKIIPNKEFIAAWKHNFSSTLPRF